MGKKVEFDDALKGIYHEYDEVQRDERTVEYKEVGSLAVGSLVCAVATILGFFWKPFVLLGLLGAVLGYLAIRKILRAPDEVTGFAMAVAGTALSLAVGIGAVIFQTWNYYHNAPPGYEIIDFADMAFDPATGKVKDEIAALSGKKVFVTGYMYPTNRQSGIEDFTLVRTLGHCKFCSPGTNPADMIAVSFQGGMSVSFKANKAVSVGGILNVDPDYASGEIPYSLENVDVFR